MIANLHNALNSARDMAREVAEKRLVLALASVGERCVAEAVGNGNYTDRTGNLRSSIGYVVAVDGSVVAEGGFGAAGGPEGPQAGRSKAAGLVLGSRGAVLVVVAGMNYAQFVADKGFNVLDSAEILARQLISRLNA